MQVSEGSDQHVCPWCALIVWLRGSVSSHSHGLCASAFWRSWMTFVPFQSMPHVASYLCMCPSVCHLNRQFNSRDSLRVLFQSTRSRCNRDLKKSHIVNEWAPAASREQIGVHLRNLLTLWYWQVGRSRSFRLWSVKCCLAPKFLSQAIESL